MIQTPSLQLRLWFLASCVVWIPDICSEDALLCYHCHELPVPGKYLSQEQCCELNNQKEDQAQCTYPAVNKAATEADPRAVKLHFNDGYDRQVRGLEGTAYLV